MLIVQREPLKLVARWWNFDQWFNTNSQKRTQCAKIYIYIYIYIPENKNIFLSFVKLINEYRDVLPL